VAVTAYASGTQSASVSTEHFLSSPNVAATYQFVVDTVNMAAGDTVELRVYSMVLTGGTQRVLYYAMYTDAQPTDDLIKVSVPFSTELTDTNATRVSLKQTTGTGRSFPWKVLKFS